MKQTLLQYIMVFLSTTSFLLPSNSSLSSKVLAPQDKPNATTFAEPEIAVIVPSRNTSLLRVSTLDVTAKPTFVFPHEDGASTSSRSTSLPLPDTTTELTDSASTGTQSRRASQHGNAIFAAKMAIIALRPRQAYLSSDKQSSSLFQDGFSSSSTKLAEFSALSDNNVTPKEAKRRHRDSIQQARLSITALQQFGSQKTASVITPKSDNDDQPFLSTEHLLDAGAFTASAALTAIVMNHRNTSSNTQPVKRFMTGLEIPAAIQGASFLANACAFTAAGVTTIYAVRKANQWVHSGCEAEKDLAVKRARDEFQKMLADTVRQFNSRFEAVAIDMQELAEVQQENSDKMTVALHHVGDALVALGSTTDINTDQTDIAHDRSQAAHEKAIAAQSSLTVTQQLAGQAHSTAHSALAEVKRIGEELQKQLLEETKKPGAIKSVDIPVTAKEESKGCWCC